MLRVPEGQIFLLERNGERDSDTGLLAGCALGVSLDGFPAITTQLRKSS
jgi:hypothetical protein